MDIEKAAKILTRARQLQKDPEMHDVIKIITELVFEFGATRSAVGLLELRIEQLEGGVE